MRFKVPGRDMFVRVMHPVATTDGQYDIFDTGLEQEDGSIDSIAIGGSFSYAKSLIAKADEQAAKAKAEQATPAKKTVTVVAEPVAA